jgi:formyl-CoA transferase
VGNDAQFDSLCAAINCDHLSSDPLFISNSVRVLNRQTLIPLIAAQLAKQSAVFWLMKLEEHGIPVGPVNSIGEAFADPHVTERQTVSQLEHASLGRVATVRSPIRFQNCVVEDSRAAPALGDSTEAVLHEIGLSDVEIKDLLSNGVVEKSKQR